MKPVATVLLLAAVVAAGLTDDAFAQAKRPPLRPAQPPPTPTHPTFGGSTAGDRVFVTAGSTFQLTSASFSSSIQPLVNAERAAIDTHYAGGVLPGFDFGGGARVWRQMTAGVAVEHVTRSGSGQVSAQIPHPFFFNRARAVSGNANDLHHSETDVHIQAMWTIPVSRRVEVAVGGGPSWIRLTQDLVSDVTVNQTYPYDTATFNGVVGQPHTESTLGFNAGMTLDYRFAARVGLDMTARYSHGHVRFDNGDAGSINVNAGGGHVGAGVRFWF